ncbi:MAG: peptidyl-prolyl cis-trans isomerase [Acidobacteria bacterium]|nr:peptidyl-prolyl cis-trans isomerase [Acidobacteriota bacterium]
MKRVIAGVLAVAVFAGGSSVLMAQAQAPATSRSVVLQRVLVKVNGAVYTKTQLEEEQIQVLQQRNEHQLSQLDLQSDEKLRAMLIEITPGILAGAVDELILLQRGRELGIKPSAEQFNTWLTSIKTENGWDDAMLKTALVQQGMTLEQLRSQFDNEALKRGVAQQEVMNRMTITEEEAHQYYRANPQEFMTPSLMTLREIFIAVPTEMVGGQESYNVAADEAALAKITSARERALKGEDLVTEISESGSKANGGLIGPVNLNEIAEALRERLEPLKTGDIDQPIRTPKGYQLLKVESRSEASVEPFDKVRSDIGNRVAQARSEELMEAYLKTMREQAIIEWKDDELKKLYEQHIAQQKKTN